jgi:hypothetical protein
VKLAVTDAVEPDLIYKDHRIIVGRVGKGWRAMIYAPGSNTALRESPASLEECRKEAIAKKTLKSAKTERRGIIAKLLKAQDAEAKK